jgi:succinoglycan biosynthesis protein ExoA
VPVSIIVPCRNEVAHVASFLTSVFGQLLPPTVDLEVIVADGASTDGTRAELATWQAREQRLLVIDNPEGIVSTGLNRALRAARGETIVRMDVHTEYATDYVAQCLDALDASGATCVGGPWVPTWKAGGAARQRQIALAFQSRFGSGGASSRRTEYTGEVDTVYLGAWRRSELLRLGGFDETMVRNQDDELNLRIVNAGGRVWQSAAIRSRYTPRASFAALFRQLYQYGYWKVPVIRKHRLPASPRHLVPFAFVATVAMLAAGGVAWPLLWTLLAGLLAVYAAAALANARPLADGSLRDALGIAWCFACMHVGYGLGFARALLDFGVLRRSPGASATRLTR